MPMKPLAITVIAVICAITFSGAEAWAAVSNLSIASSAADPSLPAQYSYTQSITFSNTSAAPAYNVTASVVLLAPETSYSQVKLVHESMPPQSSHHDQYGNLIGTFTWPEIPAHRSVSLTLSYQATSSDVTYQLPASYPPYNVHSSVYQFYTNPHLEAAQVNTDSPVLERIDQSVVRPGENPEQKAHAIYQWIVHNIRYNYSLQASGSAVATALSHLGICSDFADLYIGLLRTAKIPARFVGGYVTSNGSGQGGFHQWTEFYLPRVGWVVADPTWGNGYFAQLQDHWHIGLYDGIRKDITVNWSYNPAALSTQQATNQIRILYQYHFQKEVPASPLKPPFVRKHPTKTKVRPILAPTTVSHKVHGVPLSFWQQLWLNFTGWFWNQIHRVNRWFRVHM
ncbi:MAG: transglutaminase domain-containing protein [Firmicutes bacterium]|uniref:Transglutaminase n=1 Tax=Sulfobacillus benefaciens TaxID=453960 RepID=A0A2T2X765_9FIRM|nr:transglutaminase domain-containing protein [Bacillota bacterium]MCL5012604.1 transglutaminase domain-containing protein [Bacillota bacterium]PSR30332.1 MAG: transglutaminase [Sulfobacillus benefaciens]HBQ95068.1 transglutaminase [Sulfobacillus sp.]